MSVVVAPQLLSVIIPSRNRAGLLRTSLKSLTRQTIAADQFEVIVVDDGSSDTTPDVCRKFSSTLPLRYFRLKYAGISSAKNLGIFTARGSVLLFFDDDDIADNDLCRRHLETHMQHPESQVVVLGYTTWASSLKVTPVMEYITNIGHLLFSYANLTHGENLDFTYFWGGRSSCKRLFLVKHGIFNQHFQKIIEDIELGYRLSKFGLKVIFNRHAVQYMNREVTFDGFCQRCEVQGASLWHFSRLHSDPIIQQYCQVVDAEQMWRRVRNTLLAKVKRVHELESLLQNCRQAGKKKAMHRELKSLYKWTFDAFKLKGIAEASKMSEPRDVRDNLRRVV